MESLIQAHPTVGQTLFSDTLGPTWRLLKWTGCLKKSSIMRYARLISTFWGKPATLKAAMSAPKYQKITFDQSLDAPGSGFPIALRINIVQQTLETVATFLWKSNQICDFHLKSICGDSRFWGSHRLQKLSCRPQSVEIQRLTHGWMRQDQSFPAHVKLISYNKHARL